MSYENFIFEATRLKHGKWNILSAKMNYFLSTKQSGRTRKIQQNTWSKVGESTCPPKTPCHAYCNYVHAFINPGVSYTRLSHFLPEEDQNVM